MDAQSTITVSAAVVALVQILKWSPMPTTGLVPVLLVFLLSALGVILWALSVEPAFQRALIFPYFAGWIAVATSAAGVFGLAQRTAEVVGGKP